MMRLEWRCVSQIGSGQVVRENIVVFLPHPSKQIWSTSLQLHSQHAPVLHAFTTHFEAQAQWRSAMMELGLPCRACTCKAHGAT